MKKEILYHLLLILLVTSQASGQLSSQLDWFASYDGIGLGNDFVNDIKFDNKQNCYLSGRSIGADGSQDLLIVKYSDEGELLRAIEYMSAPNSWDEAVSIAIDTDQNIYVAGNATFGQSTFSPILQKYSASGEILWEKNYQNSLDIAGEGIKVVLDTESNVIAGVNNSGTNIIKYSADGDSLWSVNINDGTSWFTINDIITDMSSNIYFIYTRSFYDGGDIAETEINISKINKAGNINWNDIIEIESPRKMLFDLDSNLVIASHGDAKIIKLSLSGELIWDYNSSGLLTDISVDNNNDIVMCGYNSGIGNFDYMIKKISKEGNEVWSESFNSAENMKDFASSICVDKGNNVFVTGNANDTFTQGISYTLKYDSQGELKWQFRYDIPHSKFEHPESIILDDSNNVIIAGDYTDSTNGSNFFIMKIDQRLGTDVKGSDKLINHYSLSQNYPNPFNPSTKIEFTISKKEIVKIEIYDALGKKIEELLNQEMSPGFHSVNFNASNYSSGVYFYRLIAGEFMQTRKAILLE